MSELTYYRKKPVAVTAFHWTGEWAHLVDWLKALPEERDDAPRFVEREAGSTTLAVQTVEGTMLARLGDWIICGVHGELYPCKADIFDETYEEIDA